MMRRIALAIGLSGLYFLVLTPLAWWLKSRGRAVLGPGRGGSWSPVSWETGDASLYVELGCGEAKSWPALRRAAETLPSGSLQPWTWPLLRLMRPWAPLAAPPEVTALSGDLYVLF
jgi:hypothetical protein